MDCQPTESSHRLIDAVDESHGCHCSIDVSTESVSFRLRIIEVGFWRTIYSGARDFRFRNENSSGEHAAVRIDNRLCDAIHNRVICFSNESQTSEVVQNELMISTWPRVRVLKNH